MKTKEEILKEAYLDIMYTTKNPKEILENVYEYGFANGFKQGNDNAREVADFEKKKQKEQKSNLVEKLREISTPADEDWFEIQKQWEMEDDKQNQKVNLDHFKSYMLQYLQDAANRKDDSEIEKDTDVWAKKLLNLLNIDI